MLDCLKKYDADTAGRILAAVALSSNNPGVGAAAKVLEEFAGQQEEVVAELQTRAKARATGRSIEGTIAEILSELMREAVLAGKDREKILFRAGAEGRLPPNLFIVEFSGDFAKSFPELGTRPAHVIDAIQHSDAVHHVHSEGDTSNPPHSLFLKAHRGRKQSSFLLIVVAERRGKTLTVKCAFRVYPSDVELGGALSPVDVLSAFVEKYGFETKFGATTSKFIQNRSIPPSSVPLYLVVTGVRGFQYFGVYLICKSRSGPIIGISFTINLTVYAASLRNHGIRAQVSATPAPSSELRIPVFYEPILLPEGTNTFQLPI